MLPFVALAHLAALLLDQIAEMGQSLCALFQIPGNVPTKSMTYSMSKGNGRTETGHEARSAHYAQIVAREQSRVFCCLAEL